MGTQTRRIVIVGGGLAGAKAAETLREEGFDGTVTLVGDEPERPYERPPLSKEYLRGETEVKPYVHPESFYADNEVELLTATPAAAIDPGASEVVLGDGRRLGYDRLLLATGAEPRRIDVPGAELDGIHYLRTLADSEAIAAAIEGGGAPRRRRLGLDRGRDRGVGAGEGVRGDDDRDGLAAARAGARAASRAVLPRRPS